MEYYATIKGVIIEEFNDLGIFFLLHSIKLKSRIKNMSKLPQFCKICVYMQIKIPGRIPPPPTVNINYL